MEAKNSHIIIGDANDGTTDGGKRRRMHDSRQEMLDDGVSEEKRPCSPKVMRLLRLMDGRSMSSAW